MTTALLKKEIDCRPAGTFHPSFFRLPGYKNSTHTTNVCRRADAVYSLFVSPIPHIFKNDWIVGSIRPYMVELDDAAKNDIENMEAEYPERGFLTNFDHYAPDYNEILQVGISGILKKIEASRKQHSTDKQSVDFLEATEITINALKARFLRYADQCTKLYGTEGYDDNKLSFIEENCRYLSENAPVSFAQALQLVWMIHTCFVAEGRYAMALGRLDRYLYPFYKKDVKAGILSAEFAEELLQNVFMKIYEHTAYTKCDDVVNICIGGMRPSGECDINPLSYCILHAVEACKIPGPNLSARITPNTPDDFLDDCLKVIGTGLGYPALMNDSVNIEALSRYGYKKEDVYNYSMVGCIENFITGKQPPWSDGRFDTPRYFEYLFNDGKSYDGKTSGIDTGSLDDITSMNEFMERFERQLAAGADEYMKAFYASNTVVHPENYTSPFLSCFCDAYIQRGLDINMGGSVYPSVHGAGLMGVGTTCDSLAAIEKTVFVDKALSLKELKDAMKADFKGYEDVRQKLLSAPKYGNNDSFVDKYAVWFVDFLSALFNRYKTKDGGGIYVAMAANINNISAGKIIGATPDGRYAGSPLSDAASPTYGTDTKGPTSTFLSVTKPSYEKIASGTVVNQKFPPSVFENGEKRKKLLHLIRVYFSRGGQEIQINATSTDILKDAMLHPENYGNLVVRVSGFSAFYVTLDPDVQMDILHRTQQQC